jgi:uncharacterized protein (DUF2461 family)
MATVPNEIKNVRFPQEAKWVFIEQIQEPKTPLLRYLAETHAECMADIKAEHESGKCNCYYDIRRGERVLVDCCSYKGLEIGKYTEAEIFCGRTVSVAFRQLKQKRRF